MTDEQWLLPGDRARRRGGHHEEKILAVDVDDFGQRRSAQHGPQRLNRFRLAIDAAALGAPIVFDAQLFERLLDDPAAFGCLRPFDEQNDVRHPAAQFADAHPLGVFREPLLGKVIKHILRR